MTDVLNLVMLVGASIAALGFGVFAAYGILRVAFALMRPRHQPAVKPSSQMARVS